MSSASSRFSLRVPVGSAALVFAAAFGCATTTAPGRGQEVIEIMHLADALGPVNASTLVVLDIDNTLIEPVGALGSDQWFYHLLEERRREVGDEGRALVDAMALWNRVQPGLPVQAVEPETPKLLTALRAKKVSVLALTARTPEIAEVTARQLASVGIELGASTFADRAALRGFDGAKLERGILFIGEKNEKGPALVALLRATGTSPTRVVFVDDKQKHADGVARALTEAGIAITAYRYGAADARVAAFRPEDAARELAAWQATHAGP